MAAWGSVYVFTQFSLSVMIKFSSSMATYVLCKMIVKNLHLIKDTKNFTLDLEIT